MGKNHNELDRASNLLEGFPDLFHDYPVMLVTLEGARRLVWMIVRPEGLRHRRLAAYVTVTLQGWDVLDALLVQVPKRLTLPIDVGMVYSPSILQVHRLRARADSPVRPDFERDVALCSTPRDTPSREVWT